MPQRSTNYRVLQDFVRLQNPVAAMPPTPSWRQSPAARLVHQPPQRQLTSRQPLVLDKLEGQNKHRVHPSHRARNGSHAAVPAPAIPAPFTAIPAPVAASRTQLPAPQVVMPILFATRPNPVQQLHPLTKLCTWFVNKQFPFSEGDHSNDVLYSKQLYCAQSQAINPLCLYGAFLLLVRLQLYKPSLRFSPCEYSIKQLFLVLHSMAVKQLSDTVFHRHNKTWASMDNIPLVTFNKLESDMARYLQWDLSLRTSMLMTFQQKVDQEYSSRIYITREYPCTMISSRYP